MDKLLHTPEGVRDIYNSECEQKLELQRLLSEMIHEYGFHEIQTPMFEFFDIFSQERGTVAAKDMYKFFDREGNTLALRPDITPCIARCVAKYYKDETLPIRLSYCGDTFINHSGYQGKLKETTQLGTELINDPSIQADAEMIVLTIQCLKASGLEDFLIEIGQADFFRALMISAKLQDEEVEQLRLLIEQKNMFGVEELLEGRDLNKDLLEVIKKLPSFYGTIDKVHEVAHMVTDERAINALKQLEQLYTIITYYGCEKYITFDLGMLSKYNYYTGIIFHGITYGLGEAIVTGGRYDALMEQFDKPAPAIGMVILVDSLLAALQRQKRLTSLPEELTLLLYEKEQEVLAIQVTQHLRKQHMKVQLLQCQPGTDFSVYEQYASRIRCGGILYCKDQESIEVIHLKNQTRQTVLVSQLCKE